MYKPGKAPPGSIALAGEVEYIRAFIFEAVDEDRYLEVKGRGTLILIIDPTNADNTKPYEDIEEDTNILVPAGYKVKAIDAYIKMAK